MQATRRRILYLDEDEQRSFILTTRLRLENYDTVTTEFASDALELARSEPFDLYLLSKRFPVESGAYLCQKLSELTPETPIIFFTNSSDGLHEQEVIRTGAREHVVEAGDLKELLMVMKHLLSEKMELALATA
jgi:DNA-binding response OmpR family regulator